MPGPPSRLPSTRKRAILEAALECFTSYGFAKTTMDDIRVQANASTGSLYHHFRSKEQLAAELYVEAIRYYQQGLKVQLTLHQSAEAGIRGVVIYHLQWVDENPAWARYLAQSRQADFVQATEPAMRELNREMKRRFGDWVRPFVEAGEVRDLPPDLCVALLVGSAQDYARMRLSGRSRTDLETATRVLADAAWRVMRTDPEEN